MLKYLTIYIITLSCFLANYAIAQEILPVHFNVKQTRDTELSYSEIVLQLSIVEGWKIYSNTEQEALPFNIELYDYVNLESYTIKWPMHEKINLNGIELKTFVNQAKITIKVKHKQNFNTKIKVTYGACKDYCIKKVEFFDTRSIDGYNTLIKVNKNNIDKSFFNNLLFNSEFYLMLLSAMVGGLILNFMPCVLPVLSLKIYSVVKHSSSSIKTIKLNLIFIAIGIVVSFIILAILTEILKVSGRSVGWGFTFQEPKFVCFMVIVLIIFANNLWGNFEISLQSTIENKIYNYQTKYTYLNSLLSGCFTTFLATPCTAPFLSVAIAFGLNQDFYVLLLIYILIGLGMAAPFIVLSIFPSSLKYLPKSGPWMIKLKRSLAILLIISVAWMLYILSHQISFKSLLILICCIMLSKLILQIKPPMCNGFIKIVLLIIVVTMGYFIVFDARENNYDKQDDGKWEEFSQAKLSEYINEGKMVFIDVTAQWCLICKMNKLAVIETQNMIEFLAQNKIKLLRGDYTNQSEEIADFLKKHNRYSIPFNAVCDRNGCSVLPEILTKEILKTSIDNKMRLIN